MGFRYPDGNEKVRDGRTAIQHLAEDATFALGRIAAAGLQAGAIDSGSYEGTRAPGGARPTIDIASHIGAGALVRDDSAQLLVYVGPTVAKTTKTIATGHATLPRVDRVVLELDGDITVLAGTPTSGADADNLDGAASVPDDAMLLADIPVPATDTTIANSQIRDRRTWANGAHAVTTRNTDDGDNTDYAFNNGAYLLIDSTNLAPRVECSGVPVEVFLRGT